MSSGLEHVVSEEGPLGPEVSGNGYEIVPMNAVKENIDDKYFKRFVKATEGLIRRSNEYREFVAHILGSGSRACSFLPGVSTEDATVELHHHPLTLYEVVEVVAEKRFVREEPVSTFDVADEVLRLHWEGMIGVIPLSRTVHQLAHDGEVFVGIDRSLGRVADFLREYADGTTEQHRAKIEAMINDTKANRPYSARDVLRLEPQRLRLRTPQFVEAEIGGATIMLLDGDAGEEPGDFFDQHDDEE